MPDKYRMGDREFEAESRHLTLSLRDSSNIAYDVEALRKRMNEDGFRFIRGFHDPGEILACRKKMLKLMREWGALDPHSPLIEGVARSDRERSTSSVRANDYLKTDCLKQIVYG